MDPGEATQFKRIKANVTIDRANEVIAQYHRHIDFCRRQADYCRELIGHIAGRLGEPEPQPPPQEFP